jgi:hypothetical protein
VILEILTERPVKKQSDIGRALRKLAFKVRVGGSGALPA